MDNSWIEEGIKRTKYNLLQKAELIFSPPNLFLFLYCLSIEWYHCSLPISLPSLEIYISHIQSVTKSHPFDDLSVRQICTLTVTEFVQASFLALTIVIVSLIVVSSSMALWLELVQTDRPGLKPWFCHVHCETLGRVIHHSET